MSDWGETLAGAMAGARTVIVLGVGNEMMADDGAGMLAAREVRRLIAAGPPAISIEAFECSTTPENFTGVVRQRDPDLVIIIDAADLKAEPGTIRVLDPAGMQSLLHSTHTLPLSFLAGYLAQISRTKVTAIGIQPAAIRLDIPMDRRVAAAVKEVVRAITTAGTGVQCGER